jgi:hypothetical protein
MDVPVMAEPSAVTRNWTTFAISSGRMRLVRPALSPISSRRRVSVPLGQTAFTSMPYCFTSAARQLGEDHNTGLGGAIGAIPGEANEAAQRPDVDDLAGSLPNHSREHGAGAEKSPREVHLQDPVPIGNGKVYHISEWDADAGVTMATRPPSFMDRLSQSEGAWLACL